MRALNRHRDQPEPPLNTEKALHHVTLATTREAASFLNFEPQTLRRWACRQVGPIQPLRIGKRLRWRWADLRKLAADGDAK